MEKILQCALDDVYSSEFESYENAKKHCFSLRHRRMMKSLFKNALNMTETEQYRHTYIKSGRKRFTVITAIVIASVLLTAAVAAAAVFGFGFRPFSDHTVAFSENIVNAPKTIEQIYVLSALPDRYTETERSTGATLHSITYQNSGNILTLTQTVKNLYKANYNTERDAIERTDVYGKEAFYLTVDDKTVLVWDNGDYIFELVGNFDKATMINMAGSTNIEKD